MIALVSFCTVSIANNTTKEFKKIELNVSSVNSKDEAKTTCCTRRGKSSNGQSVSTVSYTHLDVYKRQPFCGLVCRTTFVHRSLISIGIDQQNFKHIYHFRNHYAYWFGL